MVAELTKLRDQFFALPWRQQLAYAGISNLALVLILTTSLITAAISDISNSGQNELPEVLGAQDTAQVALQLSPQGGAVIPDETPIDPVTYDWKGESAQPKYINIPSISSEGFVEQVGTDSNGKIGVPRNTNLSGWYQESALPGERGLSVIAGHLDGYTRPAIFSRLAELEQGETFSLERGDGQLLNYRVVDSVTVPEPESIYYLFSQKPTVTSQLNLITCGGYFDRADWEYADRTIVMAELI